MNVAEASSREFSWPWVLGSMCVFLVVEAVLGGIVGKYVLGRYLSHSFLFLTQGLLNLSSYFIGGVLVGLFSPGLRISEPALGAFFSVALMLGMSFFTPYTFIRFSASKLLIGGVIAYALALAGAKLGERLAGNRIR